MFGVHIEGAVNRVPCVEQTGIKSTVCGPGLRSNATLFCLLFLEEKTLISLVAESLINNRIASLRVALEAFKAGSKVWD